MFTITVFEVFYSGAHLYTTKAQVAGVQIFVAAIEEERKEGENKARKKAFILDCHYAKEGRMGFTLREEGMAIQLGLLGL